MSAIQQSVRTRRRTTQWMAHAEREDAAQEVALSCLRVLEEGKRIVNVEAFVEEAMRRQAGKEARDADRRPCLSTHLGEVHAALPPARESDIMNLRSVLPAALASDLNDVLSGKTDEEIANDLDISRAAVRKRRSRLETRLREILESRRHK